jgi:ribosomal protein S18 acetylase RimI-like enzyme
MMDFVCRPVLSMKTITAMEALHANHRAFLSAHRGRVVKADCCLALQSERPEFTYAMLGQNCDVEHILHSYSTVHLLPGAEDQAQSLLGAGYKENGALSYMVLTGDVDSWKALPQLEVRKASTLEDIDRFSHVQTASFLDNAQAYEEWHTWLGAANKRNLTNQDQTFYIGYLDSQAVGVCLFVFSDDVAGIYAVATLPEQRKKGVSTTIMKQAIIEAGEKGYRTFALQVAANSYAQSFYEKLGFDLQYTVRIFKRPD